MSTSTSDDLTIVEIYIDRATLPSIQQMAMIATSMSTHPKLICWLRYPIRDLELLAQLNANSFDSLKSLCQYASEHLTANTQLVIYANTYWSKDLARLIRRLAPIVGDKIRLELIDDGSSEYQKMFQWQQLPIARQRQDLEQGYNNLKAYLVGSEYRLLRALRGQSNKLPRAVSSLFNWHRLFPTTYHMLRMDYLDKPELGELKAHLAGKIQQIRWDHFKRPSFSKQQQRLFYRMLGISDPSHMTQLSNGEQQADFMFIGANGKTASYELQRKVLADSRKETGVLPKVNANKLLFKGHPAADFNQKLIEAQQMDEMPPMLPFELLIMTDHLPRNIGGMESSLYFSLPSHYKVEYIVFASSKQQLAQHAVLQIMLYLKVISLERIFFVDQFD